MASNPMQRKARNSFLAGFFIAVIVAGVIIALLIMQMNKMIEEQEAENMTGYAYILTRDIKSGEVMTINDFVIEELPIVAVPVNGLEVGSFQLKDLAEGEDYTDEFKSTITAKIDLSSGVVALDSMFNINEEQIADDIRTEEFNMITLPMDLQTGEYIDIRITFPSGVSYVVLSKKQVEIPMIGYSQSTDTIRLELSEAEISTINSAIIEAYQIPGTKIYANKYVEPGLQTANNTSYPVNPDVVKAVELNPNLTDEAKYYLKKAYSDYIQQKYDATNAFVDTDGDSGYSNIESGVSEDIVKTQEAREEYLESMQQEIY